MSWSESWTICVVIDPRLIKSYGKQFNLWMDSIRIHIRHVCLLYFIWAKIHERQGGGLPCKIISPGAVGNVTACQRCEAAGGVVITGAGYGPCSWDLRRGFTDTQCTQLHKKKNKYLFSKRPVTTNIDLIHFYTLFTENDYRENRDCASLVADNKHRACARSYLYLYSLYLSLVRWGRVVWWPRYHYVAVFDLASCYSLGMLIGLFPVYFVTSNVLYNQAQLP